MAPKLGGFSRILSKLDRPEILDMIMGNQGSDRQLVDVISFLLICLSVGFEQLTSLAQQLYDVQHHAVHPSPVLAAFSAAQQVEDVHPLEEKQPAPESEAHQSGRIRHQEKQAG